MLKRFMAIWFRHLLTDGLARRRPELKDLPFVLVATVKNKIMITASSAVAEQEGAFAGMAVADTSAAVPELLAIDDVPGQAAKLLRLIGLGCSRYTPMVSLNLPDGVMLDISGCAHLWGGEREYLKEIVLKLRAAGFDARASIADTLTGGTKALRYSSTRPNAWLLRAIKKPTKRRSSTIMKHVTTTGTKSDAPTIARLITAPREMVIIYPAVNARRMNVALKPGSESARLQT
jgi:hypothetical protein